MAKILGNPLHTNTDTHPSLYFAFKKVSTLVGIKVPKSKRKLHPVLLKA